MSRAIVNAAGVALLLLGPVGCHYGPQIETLDEARRPEGAEVTVHLKGSGGSPPRGELLDVRRESLVVNIRRGADDGFESPRLVTLIGYELVDYVDAGVFGRLDPGGGSDDDARARLRRVSRFPQGLAPELLDQLLEAQGQETLAILE
jgi:hypothetical protein